MKTINDNTSLTSFEFWSGAKDHSFNNNELQEIENQLTELYPEGMTETQINDLFWFEEEFLCSCIGLKYKKYLKR